MAILGLIGISLLLALIFGPQYWVKHVIKKHSMPRPDLPGTGGELATHLIEEFDLGETRVEATNKGDHFDPDARKVRLSQEHFDGRSIAAVAIAAHEVGHAIQHHHQESKLKMRQTLIGILSITDMFASVFFLLAPIAVVFVRSPAAMLGLVGLGISFLAIRLIVHLVTLPVEFDASFDKALPILEQGGYLNASDMKAAKTVLRAAAMTYVAAALASLLDITRWIRMIR